MFGSKTLHSMLTMQNSIKVIESKCVQDSFVKDIHNVCRLPTHVLCDALRLDWVLTCHQTLTHLSTDFSLIPKDILSHNVSLES